jgi:hypothetical protein
MPRITHLQGHLNCVTSLWLLIRFSDNQAEFPMINYFLLFESLRGKEPPEESRSR